MPVLVYGTGYYGTEYWGPEVVVASPSWLYQPHATVLIGGVVQEVSEWSTGSALDTVSTASFTLHSPLSESSSGSSVYGSAVYGNAVYGSSVYGSTSLGAEVVHGAPVEIWAATHADDAEQRVFWGRIEAIDPTFSESGQQVSVQCVGWAWLLTLPLEQEKRYGGGAPTWAKLLSSSVFHIGNQTIAWYADPSPDGLQVDYSFIPTTDARFIHVTGRQHGANSFQEAPEKDIKTFSRIEIWQSGHLRGYTNMPTNEERWRDEPDFTDDANWEDFDLTIGCKIEQLFGSVTIRFTSAKKPGSSERDDYEVKSVTYETATQSRAAQMLASVMRSRGFGAAYNQIPYRTRNIIDQNGSEILLGGNGLINNGRVVLPERTDPWAWMCQLANLWGSHGIDGPDAVDFFVVRGDPSNQTAALTLTEGVDIISINTPSAVSDVVTDWSVLGATGADAQGEPFQFASRTEGADVPSFIPNPPGAIFGELTSDLLVSDDLCISVRQIKEIETTAIPTVATVSMLPTSLLRPGSVVYVDAPSVGVERNMWVIGVRHVWSENGWFTDLDLRASNGAATPEEDPADEPEVAPSTDVYHVGTTDRTRFAHVNPDGSPVKLTWYAGDDYRAVRVQGRIHGANSYLSGSHPSVWSTVEVWQFGTMVGSARLPVSPERPAALIDYTDFSTWGSFDITMAADVTAGTAELRFYAGSALDASTDDYEVRLVTVELYTDANERSNLPSNNIDWQAYQHRRRWRWAS